MKLSLILTALKFLISRELIFQVIKKSLFTVLVIMITNEMFVTKYGPYKIRIAEINFYFINFFDRITYCIVWFIVIFLISYSFEKAILPWFMLLVGKQHPKKFREKKRYAGVFLTKIAPRPELKTIMIAADENRFDLYSYLAYLPTVLLLITVYLSIKFHILFLLLTILVFILFKWFAKMVNTVIHEFK